MGSNVFALARWFLHDVPACCKKNHIAAGTLADDLTSPDAGYPDIGPAAKHR